jgi:hypothetical protein
VKREHRAGHATECGDCQIPAPAVERDPSSNRTLGLRLTSVWGLAYGERCGQRGHGGKGLTTAPPLEHLGLTDTLKQSHGRGKGAAARLEKCGSSPNLVPATHASNSGGRGSQPQLW